MNRLFLPLFIYVGTCSCAVGVEGAFVGSRAQLECEDELPVCNTTAGCKMIEEDHVLSGTFPGRRALLVPTAGEAVIRVEILWREQRGPGADTEIIWNEPACVNSSTYESQGDDIFARSDGRGVFLQQRRVFRAGEHLVEVRSDASADYLLRTVVLTAAEADAEAATGVSVD
jgi:hypothetical protein